MRLHGVTYAALLASVSGAALWSMLAPAQAADNSQTGAAPLQEIVVTAERRESRLQDTPISVTAFTTERLDAQGIRDIDDLTRLTPGVTFVRTGFTATGNYNDEDSDIAIRGVDSSAGASTTGVYIDDTPIQTRHLSFGTVTPFPALFDLDRVEVLRGPQGTLFGAGSEGGTVRFILPEPGLETYSGYYRTEFSGTENGDPSYEVAGAVGGPIVVDKLGFRLSASLRDDGGYVDKVDYDRATLQPLATTAANNNWERTATIRGALKWAVDEDLTITPSIYYQQLYLNDSAAYWPSLSDPGAGILRSGNEQANSSYDPFILGSIKVDWKLGAVELTSNTSYFYRNQAATSDYSQFMNTVFAYYPGLYGTPYPGPGEFGTAHFTDEQRNLTEELRLQSNDPTSPLTWTAGFFFAYLHENTTEYVIDPSIPLAGELPGGRLYVQNPFEAIDHQYALYGQGDYAVTPEIKLTAGVRVAIAETAGYQYYAGPFVGPTPGTASGVFTQYPVTPKFGIDYQPDKDDLFYTSVAKGYRVGGINATLGPICAGDLGRLGLTSDPASYASDSLWSYEIGAKNTLLDGKLQLSSSAFYIDWQNIQQSVYLPTCGLQFVANLGAAISKGVDFNVAWRAMPGLLLTVEGGYTNATYSHTVHAGAGAGAPVVTAGDILDPVPWTVNLSAEYDIPGFDDYDPYLRADYQYSSAQSGLVPYQDPNNGASDTTIPGVPTTNNLSFRVGVREDGLDVSAFANNVLNSLPLLVESRDTTYSPLYFAHTWKPRTIGLTATYRF